MMFQNLIDILEKNGQGVNAYQECARAARAGLKRNPELAAAYCLLGTAAQRFAETYRGEPLSVKTSSYEFARFENYVKELSAVYEGGDATSQLKALNSVAAKVFS